ncbi:MAG: hypothetical protein KDD68_20410 [Bdellovibrionales bacterium]|nr:hypothetical protein [Bdellovibrionales bacterium]
MSSVKLLMGLCASVLVLQSATGMSDPVPLGQVTPAEVAVEFQKSMSSSLKGCLARWEKENNKVGQNLITKEIVSQFRNSGYPNGGSSRLPHCQDAYDLGDAVIAMLKRRGKTSVHTRTMVRWFKEMAHEDLSSHVDAQGYINKNAPYSLLYYGAINRAENKKVEKAFKVPGSMNYKFLRTTWNKVGSGTTLDQGFFNPVQLDSAVIESDQLFSHLRKAFDLRRISYVSAGFTAIEDFWNSHEGPEGDKEFAPLATALKETAILKRFYFAGGEEDPFPWSRNILIVVDEHHQAWGFYMGYSE